MQEKILFIGLSNIGDVVMTTPVLEILHERYPEYLIDIVADIRSSELFNNCPYREKIFHKNKQLLLRGGLDLLLSLRKEKYKLCVDLRTDGFSYLINTQKRITKKKYPGGIHAVQHYLKHIDVTTKQYGDPPTKIWLDAKDRSFFDTLQTGATDKILCIAPGANFPKKIWHYRNYIKLINGLSDRFNNVYLLGSSKDFDTGETIKENAELELLNLCGKTTLLQAAAILERAELFIGNDSGLGHLAAAVNTPTVTIFGPGDPTRYAPWGKNARYLDRNGMIEQITVNDVLETINVCL